MFAPALQTLDSLPLSYIYVYILTEFEIFKLKHFHMLSSLVESQQYRKTNKLF